MKKEYTKKTVIEKNLEIDKDLIKKAESFEKKISKFGETIKPKYTLAQPFDIAVSKLNNRNFYNLLTKAATIHFPENDRKDD